MKRPKVVGIMGGMGPEAGADIFLKITEATHAKCDDEHLHIIMDSNPWMPSRQDAILHGTESPVPAMTAQARNLINAGAEVLIIGANTAHYFLDEVAKNVDVPFVNIIDEATKEAMRQVPGIKKIGILASNGAVKAGIYNRSCEKFGIEVVPLPDDLQHLLHQAIVDPEYGLKYAGRTDRSVADAKAAGDYLVQQGAEALVMGCTEIPLILGDTAFPVPLIDPNEAMAVATVKFARGEEI